MDESVKSGNKFREPYRATKLWLEAVAIFRRGVPLGRHRKQWRTYDNCFAAQDAITWFQSQLQIAFDPSISRKQTLTLLQKFYKANIITDVSKSNQGLGNSPTVLNETDFKDNGHLYKLVCASSPTKTDSHAKSSKAKVASKCETPKAQLPRTASKYDVLIQPLTQDQSNHIWEEAFINKFVQIVGYDVFSSFFKPELFNGTSISYNLTQLGPHNIVLTASKNDDLPHWLVSAMKCLANWPSSHTQENGIPNYPGFENDVYKLISDYFSSFKDKSPLLTYGLYDAFITTFIRAELFDFNSRLYSAKISNASRSRVFQQTITPSKAKTTSNTNTLSSKFALPNSPMFKLEDQYPFNASESVENLIIDILTPAKTSMKHRAATTLNARKKLFNPNHQTQVINMKNETTTTIGCNPKSNENGERANDDENVQLVKEAVGNICSISSTMLNNINCTTTTTTTTPLTSTSTSSIPFIPNAMPPQDYNVNRYTNPLFYETAFTANSPITRVVSHTELKATLGQKSSSLYQQKGKQATRIRPPAQSANAILDSSHSHYAYENPFLELSGSDLINHPKYSRLLEATDLHIQDQDQNLADTNILSSSSFWNYSNSSSAGSGYITGTESSSSTTNHNNNGLHNISLDGFMRKTLRTVSATNLSDAVKDRHPYAFTGGARHGGKMYGQSLANQLANSPSKSVRRMLEFYYGADACVPGLMTTEGKSLAILSFRLLTLLLPPVNRRHLQILLRFMSKTSRNDKLMLDVAVSTRAIIINTFFRCILRSENPAEYDELLALRIVTFLMDNDHEIFSVMEDNDIVTVAQDQISKQQVIKIPTVENKPEEKSNVNMTNTNCNNMIDNENTLNDYDIYAEANKENNMQYCSRITMDEFEDQRLLSSTSVCLRELLDTLISNDKLDEKDKRKQILKFKDEYPHIFREKFGDDEIPSFLNDSTKSKGKKEKKLWNPLKAFRL